MNLSSVCRASCEGECCFASNFGHGPEGTTPRHMNLISSSLQLNDRAPSGSGSLLELLPTDVLLRILCYQSLSARELAFCAVSCRFLRQTVDLPGRAGQVSLPLTEAAAWEGCRKESLYCHVPERVQGVLRQRCRGSWKLTLHYLQALRAAQSGSLGQSAACRDFTLLVSPGGVLYSCGSGADFRLGTGSVANIWHPVRPSSLRHVRVRHVSVGARHTVLCTNGGAVYTWGIDQRGCCGHGLGGLGELVGDVVPTPRLVEALTDVQAVQVAAGFDFSAVLSSEGQVATFGSNRRGCLGHGAGPDETIPRCVGALQGYQVGHIAAGLNHVLGATAEGHVYTWGEGTNGKLGHGRRDHEELPRRVERLEQLGVHVTAVSGGVDISVALGACGQVYTWGWGCSGRLGHGGYGDEMLPLPVRGLEDARVVQIGATSKRTFAVTDLGHVYTFGWAAKRALELSTCRVVQASMGTGHTVVVSSKGKVLAYGAGERGQLGFNPDTESMHVVLPTPVPLPRWLADDGSGGEGEMELSMEPGSQQAHRPLEPYRAMPLRSWGRLPVNHGGHMAFWSSARR